MRERMKDCSNTVRATSRNQDDCGLRHQTQEKNPHFQPVQWAYLGRGVYNQRDCAVAAGGIIRSYANLGWAHQRRRQKHCYKSYPQHNCTTKILLMLILEELYSSYSNLQLTKLHGCNDKAIITKLVFQIKCTSTAQKGVSYRFHKRHTNMENCVLFIITDSLGSNGLKMLINSDRLVKTDIKASFIWVPLSYKNLAPQAYETSEGQYFKGYRKANLHGWMELDNLHVLQLPLLESQGLSHEQNLCSSNLHFHTEVEPNWTGCEWVCTHDQLLTWHYAASSPFEIRAVWCSLQRGSVYLWDTSLGVSVDR